MCAPQTPSERAYTEPWSDSVTVAARLPDYESERADVGSVALLKVVAIDTDNLLTHFHVDGRKGPITALRANALNAGLVLIEVDVGDHVAELDARNYVVAAVVSIFMVVE